MDTSCESTRTSRSIVAFLTLVSSFDFCAECLASFITVNLGRTSEDPELPLGFTVSDVIFLKGVVTNPLVMQFDSSPILARRYFSEPMLAAIMLTCLLASAIFREQSGTNRPWRYAATPFETPLLTHSLTFAVAFHRTHSLDQGLRCTQRRGPRRRGDVC